MEPNELPDNLASIRHLTPYKTPAFYFDNLADEIVSQVHLPLSAPQPFTAPPQHYFDTLASEISTQIKKQSHSHDVQKELEALDIDVASFPKTNVYTVPKHYFETFAVPTPAIKKETPVIQMKRPAKWMKYAAAAIVTGIIATSIAFFASNRQADVTNADAYAAVLNNVTDNDLSEYINNIPFDNDMAPAAVSEKATGNFNSEGLYKSLLTNVSDNAIQDYLNENDDSNEQNNTGI